MTAGCRSKNSREAAPNTPMLPSSSRLTLTVEISPAVKPTTSNLPSGASRRKPSTNRSPPTGSRARSTPAAPTISRTASRQLAPHTAWSAPQPAAKARLCSSEVTAMVREPERTPHLDRGRPDTAGGAVHQQHLPRLRLPAAHEREEAGEVVERCCGARLETHVIRQR